MSTPTVGPFRISTSGLHANHFASTMRCWLPPDSVEQALLGSGVAMASSFTHFSTSARCRLRSTTPMLPDSLSISEMTMFSEMGCGRKRPSLSRSSGTRPMPASMASPGLSMETFFPFIHISPPPIFRRPKSASESSVRPESSRPVMPSICPGFKSKDTSSNAPGIDRRLTSSTGLSASNVGLNFTSSNSRPVI